MQSRRAVLVLAFAVPAAGAAEKMKPEEVVAHHVDAVGPGEARTAARHFEGSCAMTAPSGAGVAGSLMGRFSLDSEPGRLAFQMKFSSENYSAETFGVDGGKPVVGFVVPGRRSALGNFVNTNGLKKLEGRELHRLRYRGKKGQGDLEVFLPRPGRSATSCRPR